MRAVRVVSTLNLGFRSLEMPQFLGLQQASWASVGIMYPLVENLKVGVVGEGISLIWYGNN